MKADALSFSYAGDKYIGRPYSEMDCQAFVERCMRDCGIHEDLAGSNAWIRQVMRNGWVGTPEECTRTFGQIPKGALLFILKNDGKEPGKYRGDGIGNASHIGIYTGRNDGAIHSSSSRGQVCYSKFAGKSIKGGWNRVGLYDRFDYGKSINWVLEHNGIGGEPPAENSEVIPLNGKVISENGKPVKLRQKPSTNCAVYWEIPVGADLVIMERGESWSKCATGGLVGWMMNQFIQLDEEPPAENQGTDEEIMTDPDTLVTIRLTAAQVSALYPVMQEIMKQITEQAGRG